MLSLLIGGTDLCSRGVCSSLSFGDTGGAGLDGSNGLGTCSGTCLVTVGAAPGSMREDDTLASTVGVCLAGGGSPGDCAGF